MYLLLMLAAVAAPANKDGKTMAVDDWFQIAIYGVGGETSGPVYLQVHAGDLDGDGAPDDAVVRLDCAGAELRAAHYNVTGPRDAATGQASGKRTHKPASIVKEWGPATPQLRAMKTSYDVKKNEGARTATDGDGWTAIQLGNAEQLCPAAQAAAKAVKPRSNIQNN